MKTFNEYKAMISIIQVLESLGYKQDISKGKVNPVFKLSDGTNKIDEVVIKNPNNSSEQIYYDRNHQGGDLIEFIKKHLDDFHQFQHKNPFVKINMILGHYAKIPYIPSSLYYKNEAGSKDFDQSRYEVKDATISDLSFLLKERKLAADTVKVFIPFIKMVRDTKTNGNYINIGFPYVTPGEDNVTNYELRNYGFKGMAAGGDKSNSIWLADFTNHPVTCKNIYFFESALDAMSFYELNQKKLNMPETVFCSVGGYISNNQISNTIKNYPNAKIHTCFDSDINGVIYDIKVNNIIANLEVSVKYENDVIAFQTEKKIFSIGKNDLSLKRFLSDAAIKGNIIAHKAVGAKDFNELIMKTKDISLKNKR